MNLNPKDTHGLPDDVSYSISAMLDSTVMLDEQCLRQGDNIAAYDLGYETVARLSVKASNKVLAYCRTPGDTDLKAKLRKFVWSRTHAC